MVSSALKAASLLSNVPYPRRDMTRLGLIMERSPYERILSYVFTRGDKEAWLEHKLLGQEDKARSHRNHNQRDRFHPDASGY